jgi:hypothetical protein
VDQLKIVWLHFLGRTEKTHDNSQSQQPVSDPIFEPWIASVARYRRNNITAHRRDTDKDSPVEVTSLTKTIAPQKA